MPDPLGGLEYTWPLYLGGVIAYLIGSIPFGLVLTRLAGCKTKRPFPLAGGYCFQNKF
jgi:hypothetical protein